MACSSSDSEDPVQQQAAGSAGAAGGDAGTVPDAAQEPATDATAEEPSDACGQADKPEAAACDVTKQDCECGRCVLFRETESSNMQPGCAPVRGTAGAGEACTRHGLTIGDDTCAPGFFCSKVGVPAGAPSYLVCMKYCSVNDDCAAGEFCAHGVGTFGWCEAVCDPFADGCYAGNRCGPAMGTDGINHLTCYATPGSKQAGESCVANADCEESLGCEVIGGAKVCTPYCDAGHPCEGADSGADGGVTCQAVPKSTYMVCMP